MDENEQPAATINGVTLSDREWRVYGTLPVGERALYVELLREQHAMRQRLAKERKRRRGALADLRHQLGSDAVGTNKQ